MACPGEGGKDAMAPTVDKPVVAAKNTPTSTPASTQAPALAATKTSVTKLAVKSPVEPRKPAAQ
jgi:hypothetical protein